ncbi:MAG: DUF2795 domain-containing protein [Rubrobacter sp.]
MDLGGFDPADVKQYLDGINWPANKEDIASQAESNGAPGPVAGQVRQRLPEGEFSGPGEVVTALKG